MLDWLRQAVGLPDHFAGVIQDSASTATLAAVVTMRERALQWQGNQRGLAAHVQVRIYASDQVHTSIDRAIWIAGIGEEHGYKVTETELIRIAICSALADYAENGIDSLLMRVIIALRD